MVMQLRRLRSVGSALVLTLLVASLTFAATTLVLRPSQLHFRLTAGSGFTITSTISSSSTTDAPAVLYPGVQRYLWYHVANPLTVPITVNALSVSAVTPPAGCAASNLDTSGTTYGGNLPVPAAVGGVSGTASVAVPISLKDLPVGQNDLSSSTENCASKTFTFTFSGSAIYTDATSVALTSSPNPSIVGNPVTFTATVLAANAGADPSQPSGAVSFYTCATSACATQTVIGTGTIGAGGKATLVTSALAQGSAFVQASYPGSTTNFSASTSNLVTQTVNGYATTTTLTSSPNPSTQGQSVTLTARVGNTSGPGTPTGAVTFYLGTPTGTHTLVGSASLNPGSVANLVTSTLPAGTDSLYAVYGGNPTFAVSTSPVITQTVLATIPTSVTLTSSPNPSLVGQNVQLTAQVTKSSGTATPTGTVGFFLGTPGGSHTQLGSATLASSGSATLTTNSLPAGVDNLYAAYSGTATFAGSTSAVITQTVIGLPGQCASGLYQNFIIGSPATPVISGTNQNDFIYAPGSVGYTINGGQGSDCIQAGDGNNSIIDGNGNGDTKSRDDVVVGNGLNHVTLGSGTDSVTVGSGSGNVVAVGNGNDTLTILGGGSGDSFTSGNGSSTIFLGAGTFNAFIGGRTTNMCHLPKTPSGAPGTAAFYHDTIVNCTVVSP